LNVIYVDYHTALADADGVTLREGLADDGLHPHVLGYDIMAAVLRETLAGHGIDL
jgi:lysophospholipase L1-like esterase